ncbi:hypothetical protein [Nocardiopsis lucentensis]|uniref:hypothetical protein n=1 Tax=Nocardiopsis lucentensis TaxID=53441 RepID=UPI0003671F59|nr:hypothetical protein [Nocardiopsis lucentensis]
MPPAVPEPAEQVGAGLGVRLRRPRLAPVQPLLSAFGQSEGPSPRVTGGAGSAERAGEGLEESPL